MSQVLLTLLLLVAVVSMGLLLHTETPVAHITYPYEPSCSWIHPQSAACSLEMPSCPEPQERYDLRVYNFRREEKICCCIPQW